MFNLQYHMPLSIDGDSQGGPEYNHQLSIGLINTPVWPWLSPKQQSTESTSLVNKVFPYMASGNLGTI